MNTSKHHILLAVLGLLFCSGVRAQGVYQAGLLPSINFNYKVDDQWSLNFKTESRQRLLAGVMGGESAQKYDYVLTDFSLIAAKRVGLAGRISGGYLIRFRNGNVIHRSIQQYTYVQNLRRFRLAHRVVTDQTFSPVEATEFRLRYRLASEIPFNGESADLKEFYLKVSNEYLNNLQNSDYNLEIRFVSLLGYNLTGRQKIEFGLDYRWSSVLDRISGHSFWTGINWFIDF